MSQADQNIASAAAADKSAARKKSRPAKAQQTPAPVRRDTRQVITLASVGLLAPTHDMMTKLYRLFGLDPVDADDIAANTQQTLQQQAQALETEGGKAAKGRQRRVQNG